MHCFILQAQYGAAPVCGDQTGIRFAKPTSWAAPPDMQWPG
jgi:hypothetical protein